MPKIKFESIQKWLCEEKLRDSFHTNAENDGMI
jgi:hypothetical protein